MRYSPNDEPYDWKRFWKKLEGDAPEDGYGYGDWEYECARDEAMCREDEA